MGGTSACAAAESLILLPSGYAADRLLRLQDTIMRRRAADQLLHGDDREMVCQFLSRALFSLYLDCREAGVAEEARRLLAGIRPTRPPVASPPGGHVVPSADFTRPSLASVPAPRTERHEVEQC